LQPDSSRRQGAKAASAKRKGIEQGLDERDQQREKAEQNAREQAELDRIATMRFSASGMRV
jgi:hypothetical protein